MVVNSAADVLQSLTDECEGRGGQGTAGAEDCEVEAQTQKSTTDGAMSVKSEALLGALDEQVEAACVGGEPGQSEEKEGSGALPLPARTGEDPGGEDQKWSKERRSTVSTTAAGAMSSAGQITYPATESNTDADDERSKAERELQEVMAARRQQYARWTALSRRSGGTCRTRSPAPRRVKEQRLEPCHTPDLLDGLDQLCNQTEVQQGELAASPMTSNNDATWSKRRERMTEARSQLNEVGVKIYLMGDQSKEGWYCQKLDCWVRETSGAIKNNGTRLARGLQGKYCALRGVLGERRTAPGEDARGHGCLS